MMERLKLLPVSEDAVNHESNLISLEITKRRERLTLNCSLLFVIRLGLCDYDIV